MRNFTQIGAVLAVLSLSSGSYAAAESVTLLASDQSGSSRVRIALEGRSWSLEQVSPRQYDLVFPENDLDFDTSQIFPGRRASRIVSARAVKSGEGSRLRLSLACECKAAMANQGNTLTIDFRDSDLAEPNTVDPEPSAPAPAQNAVSEPSSQPTETPEPTVATESTSEPQPFVGGTRLAANAAPVPPKKTPSLTDESQIRIGNVDEPEAIQSVELIEEQDAQSVEEEVALAQQKLLQQLTRAAEQGLVEFRDIDPEILVDRGITGLPQPGTKPEEEPEETDETDTPLPELNTVEEADVTEAVPVTEVGELAEEDPVVEPPIELSVRARTAIDRDFVSTRSDTLINQHSCIDDDAFNIGAWGPTGDVAEQIAAYRRNILKEFDKPDPVVARDLARLYLYLGLGAEAKQVLRLYGQEVRERDLLHDIAGALDKETPNYDGPLANAGPCSGPSALWYAAAGFRAAGNDLEEDIERGIVDAFAALPVEIRRNIGPAVINNSIDSGHLNLARRLNLILERVPGDHGPGYDLAKARLLEIEGRDDEAIELLKRLTKSGLPEAAEAAILLLETYLDNGWPVPPELTADLSLKALLHRNSSLGRRVKLAEFQARAGTDGFASVLDHISRTIEATDGDVSDLRDAGHAVLEQTRHQGVGDLEYSEAVFAYRHQIAEGPSGDAARITVASEFLTMGLANAGMEILAPALARGSAEAKLTGAAIELSQNRPEATLALLEGLSGERATLLRAKALERAGSPDIALEALSEAAGNLDEERSSLAWQAGEWDGATEFGPEERRILAAFMAGKSAEEALGDTPAPGSEEEAFLAPPGIGDELTLRDAVSVMEASKTVRSLIEEALNDAE